MSRWTHILSDDLAIQRAINWIRQAPHGMRLEFKMPKRTLPQNDRMWAMLTDIAAIMRKRGTDYTTDEWKVIFMHACGREIRLLPSLDGKGFIPYGQSSSDLSKQEMTDLIEFMFAWGSENSITFHDDRRVA